MCALKFVMLTKTLVILDIFNTKKMTYDSYFF